MKYTVKTKKPNYEKPKAISLSGVAQGACKFGSTDAGQCKAGLSAGDNCKAGTIAAGDCKTGTQP